MHSTHVPTTAIAVRDAVESHPSRWLLPTLVLISALGEISTQVLIPSLTRIEGALGGAQGSLHLALSAFVASFALGQLVLGPLSDRVGRRPVLIAGLVLFLASTAGLLLAQDLAGFVTARAAQGLGACAAYVVARAMARDVWGAGAASVLALMIFGVVIAVALTPALGGAAVALAGAWQAAVVLTLLLGALALLLVLAFGAESNRFRSATALSPRVLVAGYLDLLRSAEFRGFALVLALSYGAMFAFVAGSSYVLVGELGLDPARYGAVFGVVVLGLVGGTLAAQRLARRLGPNRAVWLGTSLVAAGALGALALHAIPGLEVIGLAAPQLMLTFGGGLVLPTAVAGAVLPNGHRAGMAAGFMGFAQMAGATLTGLLLTCLPSGAPSMLGLQAASGLLAVAVSTRSLRAAAIRAGRRIAS